MLSFFYQKLNWISLALVLMSLTLFIGGVHARAAVGSPDDSGWCLGFGAKDTEEIFNEAGVDKGMKFSDLFEGSTSKDPKIKNLYIQIYKMMKQDPADTALKQVAEDYQYTQDEMTAILTGNMSTLSMTNPTLDTQDTLDLYVQIQTDYADAYEDAQTQQEMLLDTYPKEIFANGDSSDSGFDVLEDLLIVELLLFGENKPISTSTGGFNAGDDNDDVELAEPTTVETETAGDEQTAGPVTESEEEETVTPEEAEEPQEAEPEAIEEIDEAEEASEAVNPAECQEDEGLQNAFEGSAEPVATEASVEEELELEAAPALSPDISKTPVPREADEDDDDDEVPSTLATAPVAFFDYGAEASESKDWDTPKICNDIFCLVIRISNNEDEVQYQDNDNCIRCHVQYIIKALTDTTDVSLNPGKASGNLMEPSMCKRTLFSGDISLNFIPIAMPIQTPPAGDLIQSINLGEAWDDFMEDTWGIESKEKEEDDTGKFDQWLEGYLVNQSNEAAYYQQMIASDTTPSTDIVDAAVEQYEENLQAIELNFSDSNTETRFAAVADFYESVGEEMDQMNFYFSSFQSIIGTTQEVATEMKNFLKQIQ